MYMIKIMKNLLYLLVLYLFFSVNVSAEIIKQFLISGNDRISDQTIILFTERELNQDIKEKDLNEILNNLYNTSFFKEANLAFENNILTINVIENPIIQSITIKGVKSKKYSEPLYNVISMKEKSSYVEDFVLKDLNKIRNFLKYSGFYFSKVEVDLKNNDNNTVDLIYDISLGEKASIKRIKFTGNKIYKDKRLKSIIVSEEDKIWKFLSTKKNLDARRIDLDKRLLKTYYLNKGYFNIDIESASANFIDGNGFELIFNINPGSKFYFNKTNLIIPEDYKKDNFKDIYDNLNELKNESYSYDKIINILDKIDKLALSKQYEFINAQIEEKIVSSNKIDFVITVGESKKSYVNRINIMGNDITEETVIRNLLVVDEGDPFNELLNTKSINNIKRTNLFADVDFDIIDDENNSQKTINIVVEEKPTGEVSAGAGVGTSGKSFTFGIKENNFNGKGVKVNTDLTISTNSISGGVNFIIPNYNYSDKSLNTNIRRIQTDLLSTSGYKNKLNTASLGTVFEQREDLYFSPNVILKYENIETGSNASSALTKQEGDYYDINFEYGLYYDQRNQAFNPSDGYSSNFRQQIPIFSNNYSFINTYEYKKYNQISDEMIGSIKFFVRSINSIGKGKDVRISERLSLAGNKLRGFEPGRIGPKDNLDYIGGNYASAVNIGTTLPKFLPQLQSIDFNIFLDAANVWGVDYDRNLDNNSKIRSSAGLSIDWSTPVGPLNFVIAQPITKNSSDKAETFRFNLGTTF